jgi:hypothetical protein
MDLASICVIQLKPFKKPPSQKKLLPKIKKIIIISVKSMRVRPESVTHLVVKLFNVKSKFDYIDKNKQKSEITNNDKFCIVKNRSNIYCNILQSCRKSSDLSDRRTKID